MTRALALTLAAAVVWCAAIVAIHRESPRTRVSAHGLLHVAVAESLERRAPETGAFAPTPPENPLFAGRPLPYYFFFHELALATARLVSIDLLSAFEALALAAAVAVVVAGFALGRRLFGSDAAGLTTSFLVFAGAQPQGPLVLLARWLRYRDDLFTSRGFYADGVYLWGLVHPVSGAMRLGDPSSTLGPLLPYFLNVTARPLALAALMAMALALLLAAEWPNPLRLAAVALATLLCTLFSPVTGLATAGTLGAALPLAAWRRRGDAQSALSLRRAIVLALALLVGAALAWPWTRHLLGRGDAGGRLAFNVNRMIGPIASGWLVALLALLALRRLAGTRRTVALAFVIAAASLCVPTALLALPVGNEDSFFHAALVLFAVVGAGVASTWRRAGAIHLAFAPTLALLLFAYTGRGDVPLAASAAGLQRLPADGREARLYDWLRTQTPADAVVVIDPGREGRACTGNTSELPAFAARALFTDYERHYLVAPEPDAARRAALARQLTMGEAPGAEDARYLAALRRPLFVVTFDAEPATLARLAAAHGAPRFDADGVQVHAWRPRE